MSTLTKICVVLLVLLAVFASVVFIQHASAKVKWREYAADQSRKAQLAETGARYLKHESEVYRRLYEEELEAKKEQSRQHQNTVFAKDKEIADFSRQLAEKDGELRQESALSRSLQALNVGQFARIKALSGQLEGERGKNIALADQLRGTQEKIKEFAISLENAKKNAEFLQEQLTIKEGEIDDLTQRVKNLSHDLKMARVDGPIGGSSAGTVTTAIDKIDGEVLAVQGELASLNVGRASGVKKGMEFKIYRDADFIAHLKIADVYASTCAGLIENRVGEVKKGDKATTRLETE